MYRHHTGFPGGLKEITYNQLKEKDSTEVNYYTKAKRKYIYNILTIIIIFQALRKAVSGMLPKNRLRDVRLERLHIFDGEEHPYTENIIKRHGLQEEQK